MSPDTGNIIVIFETLLAALFAVLVFSAICIPLAAGINLVDLPGSEPHKRHTRPVPLAGGLALLLTVLLISTTLGISNNISVRSALIAVIPVFIFGLWDDFKNIPPGLKIIGQLTGAVLLAHQGISIRIFESPEFFLHGSSPLFEFLDWLLTIFWIVGITNAFNFVDSMDGLAVGLGAMASSFFMLVTLDSGQYFLAQYSAILIGACIGLYFFNAPPATLFLGDSGSQTLGFLLAVLGISFSPTGVNQSSSWFVPILLLIMPIFDAVLVVTSRIKRKKPVYEAALDHTYHRLLSLGISSNRAVLVMHVTALISGCLAFIGLVQKPLVANLIFLIVILIGGAVLLLLEQRDQLI